jgi:hypothetical protein
VHAQGILPAPQINLIFFFVFFSSFSSSLLLQVSQSLLLACPTSIHHHSVDDGMADARAFLSSGCACSPELGHAFKLAATAHIL